MPKHLQRQFDQLKRLILSYGSFVEEAVGDAIRALERRDMTLAEDVLGRADRVDAMEVEVEEECLHTLALYQPVAFDMRFVVAVLKINNALERIAQQAINIAEQTVFLANESSKVQPAPFDLPGMSRIARQMLKESLDALVNHDLGLARDVEQLDEQIDAIHARMYTEIERAILDKPESIRQYIHLLNVSRQLERIGDLSVNIAEDVIYMVEGDIPRHRPQSNVRSEDAQVG